MRSLALTLSLFFPLFLFASPIQWGDDLEKAKKQAKKEKKLVLAFFHSPICGTCKRLKTKSLKDEKVIQFIQTNFIPVKINADAKPKLAQKWGVPPVPALIFIKPDGEEFARLKGYYSKEALLGFLKLYAKTYPLLLEAAERLEKDPNDPRGNYCAGVVLWAQQKFSEAQRYLEDALEGARRKKMKKLEAQCHYALLRNYYTRGRRFAYRMIEHGNALLALKPEQYKLEDLDNAYVLLAIALLWQRQFKKAFDLLGEMIQKFPQSKLLPKAYHFQGLAAIGMKQKDKGIEIWKKGIEKFPKSPWSERSKIYILKLTQQGDEE